VNTGSTIGYPEATSPQRFARYDARLTNEERSLVEGLREIRSLSATLELPVSTRERAAYWFRRGKEEDLLTGRSKDALCAGCVFLAAREQRQPLTIDFLSEISPATESQIRHHAQVLRMELRVETPPAHPRDFVSLLISRLSLDMSVERTAREYLERITAHEVHVGKHPVAMASAVIYTAARELGVELTQQTVADAAGVGTVTISRHHQQIREVVGQDG
jgi:transcription initiation factor TFIIB